MKTRNKLAIGVVCGVALLLVVGVALGGGQSLDFRTVLPATKTANSGVSDKDYEYNIRINETFGNKLEDRYYAIRGVEMTGGNACGIQVVPSFVNDKADSGVHVGHWGCMTYSPVRSATLPEGYHVTGLKVCTDRAEPGGEIAGIKVWGAKLDGNGRPVQPIGPYKFKRKKCSHWKNRVDCPSGMVATSLGWAPGSGAIKLYCNRLEQDVGSATPVNGAAVDSAFVSSTGKIALDVKVENDSHTTAVVKKVFVDLMQGDQQICTAKKTGLNRSIPTNGSFTFRVNMTCAWADIKAASNCKMSPCNVSFAGKVRATVSGDTKNYPYSNKAKITKH